MLKDLEPTYPHIQTLDNGYKAHINKRVSLPGIYTDWVRADRAIAKYLTIVKVSKEKRNG